MIDQMVNSESALQELGVMINFSLSNLGNCDAVSKLEPTSTHFVDVKENYFGITPNNVSYLLKDNVDGSSIFPFIGALTLKGCMNIAVAYSDRWMSKEFIEKFVATTEDKLNQMCPS